MKNYNLIIITIILIIYAIIIQYRYIAYFIPNKIILYTPKDLNINFKEINIRSLNGWFFKNSNSISNSKLNKLLIFFHGNAGNISNRILIIKQLLDIFSNTDIYIYDYPQFGLSSGNLTITNLITTGYQVYNYWAYKYEHIGLIGESIGSGIIAEVYKLLISLNYFNMPKIIIHLNGITSLFKLINNIIPIIIKPFILPWIYELDCEKIYLKNITKLPKLLILHTPNDEIVSIDLVYELMYILRFSPNIHFIKIHGSHNQPIIDSNTIERIRFVYNS